MVNSKVNRSIQKQIKKFNHIDYKVWTDPNLEQLSNILCKNKKNKLDKVYFSGNSGAEACEAAMRMSYQTHYDSGKPKKGGLYLELNLIMVQLLMLYRLAKDLI